ncbi:MAG: hypothetical protein EZS28_004440 [Streblomastix strix]|uniref:Peptidase C1A papain C-terminal domain-containing protein n=1 Tax=Streblomastix strix TaxID=222440 RepID=A0A5J4WZS0_9EUKA|nr:MAG: hypothetical protein EZS28_004440 [Streblomastix strix]
MTSFINETHIPEQFEYRQVGYKTGIKLQQRCCLSYRIVSANMIEGSIWKKTGNLVPFEECYKFEDKDQSCQTDKQNKKCERTEIRGIFNVSEGDEDDLAIGLINYGRVGAGIDISGSDFKQYRSGIYDNINCRSSGI